MLRVVALTFIAFLTAIGVQAQYVPYYGKNSVKYDTFKWKTYKTTHFEIFFYSEEESHLERVASMAESAYDKISAETQHDIDFKIPLIFFKTQSEFEQVNYLQIYEGILGVSEPAYNRMAFAIDQPSDKLQELVLHELGHIFEFSMLFGGINSPVIRSIPPGWVMEGFAEYVTGVWDPADLMVVRDAVLTERMPFLSVSEDLIAPGEVQLGRAPYNVGHAAFEFMKDKYGEASIRQFWFYLKKAALLGTTDVMYSALGVKEEAFNEQFLGYLRERLKNFSDKQSPVDYGHEIPLPKKYTQIFSQVPSPDGKEFLVMTANKNDAEFDILKIDRSGKVLKNLTGGFTTKFEYLTTDSFTFEGRNLSWSTDGRRIAFFARTGKRRSLFVLDANSGDQIKKISLEIDQAASPALSPDGRTVVITGLINGKPDLFAIDVETGKSRSLTDDVLYEKTPLWSPDGKNILYTTRIQSRDQIFRMNATDPREVIQITSSDYDSTSPFYDPSTNSIFYAADKNSVYNLYKLDLNTGEKIQYTDVIGGNFSPVVFREEGKDKIAFTSYFKGDYRFFIMDLPQPIALIPKGSETSGGQTLKTTAEQLAEELGGGSQAISSSSLDFTADFRPAKQIIIKPTEIRDKKFRPILAARPNVITGVSGDTFAVAAGVAIQDILGDQEFRFFVSRIRGFQSYNVGYLDLGHRLQYLTDFVFNDDFFFAVVPPQVAVQTGFRDALVRDRIWGGRFISQFPLSRFYRLETSAGVFDLSQEFLDDFTQLVYEEFLRQTGQKNALSNGGYIPLGAAFVGETTRFREFGPLSGFTFRLGVEYSPPVKDEWVSRVIYEADVRKYFRISSRVVFAARGRAFYTSGDDPVIFSFGGGQDVRGFDFREIIGNRAGIANVEFRFPIFPNPRVPFLGQLRGRFFTDYFRAGFLDDEELALPENNFVFRDVDGQPFALDLEEGAGSIGVGFTVFAGGLPFNFDFSKVFGQGRFAANAPTQFEFVDGIKFDFSIGYDF